MGKRGPAPADKKNIRVLDIPKHRRPAPLPGMTKQARYVWKRIVEQFPPEHFKGHHYDQLRAYCEAAAIHKEMITDIQKEGYVITNKKTGVTKENPKIGIMDKMAARIQGLAVKLGITKNATITRDPKQQPEDKPKSKRSGLMFNG